MKIVFEQSEKAAFKMMAERIVSALSCKRARREIFNVALSGGESAKKLFAALCGKDFSSARWDHARFFWIDERCVLPEDDMCNYKHAKELFFDRKKISAENIFRIRGEECPVDEAARYSKLVGQMLPSPSGVPSFDCAVLGMGTEGHVGSIFPSNMGLIESKDLYAVSRPCENNQWRITATGALIKSAAKILCPIVGRDKKRIFLKTLREIGAGRASTPAAVLFSEIPNMEIFTDINTDTKEK